MLRNYLTTAFRNAMRRPVNTGINILGLALGVACCLIITLYVRDEYSYDAFHPDADRLYRLEQTVSDGSIRWSVTSVYHAAALEDAVPDVEATARLFTRTYVMSTGDRPLGGQTIGYADPSILEMFGFQVLHGGRDMLSRPGDIVLTRKLAESLFGDGDPVGRTVKVNNATDYTVSGVVDLPSNTHLDDVEAFVPFSTVFDHFTWLEGNPGASTTTTYARLAPGSRASDVVPRLPAVTRQVRGSADAEQLHLKAVTDIRLNPETTGSTGTQGTVDMFIAIALLILLIACVNYVNLATAGGAERLREVGMRKTFGAYRRQLMAQFIGESTLQAFVSVLLALLLVELALPAVNGLMDKSLELGSFETVPGVAALLSFALVVGLAAGAYPALYLSRFRPTQILKGRGAGRAGSPMLRRALVVVQFVASIALISGTLAIRGQLAFLQDADLGFDPEQVLTISAQSATDAEVEEFVRQIEQIPAVQTVSLGSISFGSHGWYAGMRPSGDVGSEQSASHLFVPVAPTFPGTMSMEIVAGRDFDPDRSADDRHALIINETSARLLGFTRPADAVGKEYDVNYVDAGEIVGVVKDFNINSLRDEIGPMVFVHQEDGHWYTAVRLSTDDLTGSMASIEATWARVMPEWPFAYEFIDDRFDALYRSERRTARLFAWFAGLAIAVACLGLYGLASLIARQRTREIGIRKVLGAETPSIFVLLTRGFVGLVLTAFIVAAPVTWMLMDRWLSGFAYRIDYPVWSLVVAGAATLILTLVVTGARAVRSAQAAPIAALRTD